MEEAKRKRGRFAPKEAEIRAVRSIRATDDTWAQLTTAATNLGLSPADLLQKMAGDGYLAAYSGQPVMPIRGRLEDRLVSLLDEPRITRNGKDRGTVKRVIEAILAVLDEEKI